MKNNFVTKKNTQTNPTPTQHKTETDLYLSPVRMWGSSRTRYIVGSRMQPLSSCIEILALTQ